MARLVEAFEDDMAESPDKLIPNLGDLDLKKSVVPHQRSRCFPVWLWELPVSFFSISRRSKLYHDVDCLVMSYEVCYNLEEFFFLLMLTVI